MSDLIARGKIKKIWPTVAVGSGNFEKREFSIVTDEQYPQTIMFELQQGKVVELDKHHEGENVAVSFNLRGREWVNPQGETKVFNTLQAWKIATNTTPGGPGVPAQTPQNAPQHTPQFSPPPPAATPAMPPKSPAQIEAERLGYVHKNPDFTLDQMIANKWTFDLLVQHGHGVLNDDLPF